jgi:serine/threonine protein kinase
MTDRYQSDPQGEKRFMREARAQAIVNHPNMATVLNFGVSHDGRPFLVMEYLEGQDLRALIRAEKVIPALRACELMRQICEGLDEAHAAGLVHRDLKPSNLMIVKDHRGGPWVKVLDLGLAKIIRGQSDLKSITMDTAGMLIGTPAYMSPEQVAGSSVDGRADIYALGVVFFEMLTGRLPFESETMEGWLYQHLHVKPPVPSACNASLLAWPQLDQMILRMMAKPANERYKSAGEMTGLLKKILAQPKPGTGISVGVPPKRKPGTRIAFEDIPPNKIKNPETQRANVLSELYAASPPPPDANRGNEPETLSTPPSGPLMLPRLPPSSPSTVPPPVVASAVPHLSDEESALKRTQEIEAKRQHYEHAVSIAKEAEGVSHWLEALEYWRRALLLAENTDPIKQRMEFCRREIDFDHSIEMSIQAASAGDWEKADGILNRLQTLRPDETRLEQTRARLPKKLIDAWLQMARTRCNALPEGELRVSLLERLCIAHAQVGDVQQALLTLQASSKKMDTLVIGVSQAIVAAVQYGNHEGLRPYLERADSAAATLTDPSDRGRAMLELGRAYAAYGDQSAAAAAFQNAILAFNEANSKGIPMQVSTPKSATTLRRASGEMTRMSMMTTHLNAAKSVKSSWEAALGVVAHAQAEAGLAEECLATRALIEDPWTLAATTAQLVQALVKTGRSVEAERLSGMIPYAMPKMQALRAVAVARVYRGELDGAADILKQMTIPADRIPILGLLATAYALRSETGRVEVRIAEIEKTIAEVSGAHTRFKALMGACEPLLNAGFAKAGMSLINAASNLIDLIDDPAERLRSLLQFIQIEENAMAAHVHVQGGASTRTMVFSKTTSPEITELLHRALVVWRQVRNGLDRLDCADRLACRISSAGTPALTTELLAICTDETERALVYIGLSSGLA